MGGRRKILITDGSELARRMDGDFLRRHGVELLVARDGQDVLALIEKEHPELVLLDFDMGDMAGDECCGRIKNDIRFASLPVVVVAPPGCEEELAWCRQAGCDGLLLRPIRRHHLDVLAKRFLKPVARSTVRHESALQVRFGSNENALCSGKALNLGTGGVLVETDHLLGVDTRVTLELDLPGLSPCIVCQARVAWINRSRSVDGGHFRDELGLQFLDISDENRELIRHFIATEGLPPAL